VRDTCLFCVRKHLGQAWVLSGECRQGYPHHRTLVIGHMGEAADEALRKHPDLAAAIRRERLAFEKDPSYCVDFAGLSAQVERLLKQPLEGWEAPASLWLVAGVGLLWFLWGRSR